MKYICSLFVVEDIQRARDFYEKILGQKVKSDFGENVTFHGDFSLHQRAHFQGLIDGKAIHYKSNQSELYFEDDDVDDIALKVQELGLELVHPVREQPWRQRVLRFYDYDKNTVEIGERMEHVAYRLFRENVPIEEICQITYLSEKIVLKSVQEYTEELKK